MKRLQYIVTTREREMAEYILRLQIERPADREIYWLPEDGRRNRRSLQGVEEDMANKEDVGEMGVSWHGARIIANDREKWRPLVASCYI